MTTFLFLLVNEGRIQITLKVGQHWSASKTPLKWRCADWPMMTQY